MTLKSKRLIFVSALMLLCSVAFAQHTVSGVVRDGNNNPIPGVTVSVPGQSGSWAVTDLDGRYTITVPSSQSVLSFSSMGFKTQDIVASSSTINVVMADDVSLLDESVVIGYGTVKRKDLTGAVASVKGEKLSEVPVANVSEALQGKLPGVNVVSQDGRPNASVSIRVRGGGSITQSNDPLFVVDGFPVSSINDIPASEIESIDVLKDASSTAIYGARGANGVILITTKRPQAGKLKVSYDTYMQVKKVAKTVSTLDAQDYLYYNWAYATSRGEANGDAFAKYFGLGSSYGNHLSDYAGVSTHDYTDDVLRTAYSHSHNISINGGGEKTRVRFDIGYVNDQGIKILSDYRKFNTNLKLQQEITRNLRLDLDLRYDESRTNGNEGVTNGKGSIVSAAYKYRPIDNPLGGVSFSDVASGFSFGVENIDDLHDPKKMIENIVDRSWSRYLRGSAALNWEIIQGLTARSEVSLTRSSGKSTYYTGSYNTNKTATLTRSTGKGLRWVNTLTYDFDVADIHHFNLMVGQEILESQSEYSTLRGNGYPDSFDYDTTIGLIHTATTSYTSSNVIGVPNHTLSFFGRANYSLLDRYLFTLTMRADGSSKFAPGHRWGYFPAGAFAWRISDEPFMAGTKDWLSLLKLRLSYGLSGSDNISSNLWRETWSTTSASDNKILINGERTAFYRPDGMLANDDLKWETTVSRNIGIDYGIWDGRLNGSLELYWNTTKDLLMAVPVDNTTGYSYQFQNFGQTSNKGIELSVNYDIIRNKDFYLNVGAIYNYNRNNLDKMENADQYEYSSYWASSATIPVNDWTFEVGRPIGLIRGFKSIGWYTVDDFNYVGGQYVLKDGVPDTQSGIYATYKHPFDIPSGQTAFPGAPKYEDTNGDGQVTLEDATVIAEVLPKHTGSFNFTARFRNWDFAANFNWVLGGKIYNVDYLTNASGNEFNGIGLQRQSWVKDSYMVYDINSSGDIYAVTDPTALKALNANAKYPLHFHQAGICCTEGIEDGSYLRLQNITVGYNFTNLIHRSWLSNLRVYFTASNLFCLTKYSGLDPEVNSFQTGRAGFLSSVKIFPTPNMDFGAYPRARTFTFGANITF